MIEANANIERHLTPAARRAILRRSIKPMEEAMANGEKLGMLTLGAVLADKHQQPRPVYWQGKVKDKDDFGEQIGSVFIDGRTIMGPWAIMSPASFKAFGMGLGTGRGQKYELQDDHHWLKVEG